MDINDFAVASGLLTLFIVGATELVKQAFARNWKAVVIITVAAVIGGLGAALFFPVIAVPVGIAMGLSSSGLITSLQKIGEGTTTIPSKV